MRLNKIKSALEEQLFRERKCYAKRLTINDWCIELQLKESTREQIQQIRSSPPSRRVQSRRGNVSGRYPSQKMGVTIQFESHHHELAGIYSMKYDSEVLEYYGQPPAIKLSYKSASGRQIGVRHTPDFFVIRQERAGWEEWRTTQELTQKKSLPIEKKKQRFAQHALAGWVLRTRIVN